MRKIYFSSSLHLLLLFFLQTCFVIESSMFGISRMARSKISYFCDSPFSFNTVISSFDDNVEVGGVATTVGAEQVGGAVMKAEGSVVEAVDVVPVRLCT